MYASKAAKHLWRNWLARSAVNRKVAGSSPARCGKLLFFFHSQLSSQQIQYTYTHMHTFLTISSRNLIFIHPHTHSRSVCVCVCVCLHVTNLAATYTVPHL